MTMLAENFGDLLDMRFRKIFEMTLHERSQPSMLPMLFREESSTKNYEMMSGVGGGADVGVFGGSLDYDSISQLWDKQTFFPERAKGMKVQRKLYDDDLSGIMNQRPRVMATDVARTVEKMGAEIFNGAFTGTDGPDAQPLCSSSHPYSPDDATTWDNAGSSALDATSIEATRQIGHTSIFTDKGELYEVNYDLILCTVAKEEKAYEVIKSSGKVDTPNNNVNFHQGRYKLAVWDRLTSSYPWFMIDSTLLKEYFIHWNRVAPEFNYDRDFDNYVSKWSVYFRKAFAFYDPRPVYGHLATS